jgi:AcrR family transcriptional regulator
MPVVAEEAMSTASDALAAVADAEDQVRTRIRDAAIEHIGRTGRKTPLKTIAAAAGVTQDVLIDYFESRIELMKACDEHVADVIRNSKIHSLHPISPDSWTAAMDSMDSYAPIMGYLIRSLENGGRGAVTMMNQLIHNAVGYLAKGVEMGTVEFSHASDERAKFLSINNAGGFLLYRRLHPTPRDMAAVLRDYAREMLMPAMDVYTNGLIGGSPVIEDLTTRARRIPS